MLFIPPFLPSLTPSFSIRPLIVDLHMMVNRFVVPFSANSRFQMQGALTTMTQYTMDDAKTSVLSFSTFSTGPDDIKIWSTVTLTDIFRRPAQVESSSGSPASLVVLERRRVEQTTPSALLALEVKHTPLSPEKKRIECNARETGSG